MESENFLNDLKPLKIPINGVRLPKFGVSGKHKILVNKPENEKLSSFDFLRGLCLVGFKTLGISKDSPDYNRYTERVKYELGLVSELGFTDYFLLVWDVIRFCKENAIPTGAGRGSAAGSLVLYLIGVTKIDPLKYGLYFERFISKIRAKKQTIDGIDYIDGSLAPDVDLDICFYRRPEVLKYIEEKYKGKTAKILTLNTLSGRLLIKEVGKIVGGKSEEEMTQVSNLIPKIHGVVQDIESTYENIAEFKEWCDENKRVYETALKLKDLNKNKGCHASGMLISFDPLSECCPTELTSDKELISSYDMNWVSLFTIKLDVLGLRGVSVVDDVCKELKINIQDIDINHPSIYNALQDLRYPHGLFQIESDLCFRTAQKIKPKNIKEISAVLSLSRPGAMQFIDKYALYANTGTYESVHPFFDDIVKETGGVFIYQEQMMKAAHKIGFTLDEAETLRKIVGKKKIEEMAKWEQLVYEKCQKNGHPKEIGEILWKVLDASKDYSFCYSHGLAYSFLTAITIYLKTNYPKEFYLCLLRMTKNEQNPISEITKIHKEMANFGIKLLAPSLIKSQIDFSIEGDNIRFGLSSIKGISEKTIEKLEKFRKPHSNKFEVFDAAKESGLSTGVLGALIQAGCLEEFGNKRALLTYESQLWNLLKPKEKQAANILGPKLDYQLAHIVKEIVANVKSEKGKPLIKESRFNTIKKHSEKFKKIYDQNKISQDFANWFYEKTLLGYSPSVSLREIFLPKLSSLIPISEVINCKKDAKIDFIGIIDEKPVLGTTREKKSKYAKFNISDDTGSIKVMIFNQSLEECKSLNSSLPKEGDVVIVRGISKGDAVFANLVAVQQNIIFTNLSQIRDNEALD